MAPHVRLVILLRLEDLVIARLDGVVLVLDQGLSSRFHLYVALFRLVFAAIIIILNLLGGTPAHHTSKVVLSRLSPALTLSFYLALEVHKRLIRVALSLSHLALVPWKQLGTLAIVLTLVLN